MRRRLASSQACSAAVIGAEHSRGAASMRLWRHAIQIHLVQPSPQHAHRRGRRVHQAPARRDRAADRPGGRTPTHRLAGSWPLRPVQDLAEPGGGHQNDSEVHHLA